MSAVHEGVVAASAADVTPDARAGMDRWNAQSEPARRFWLERAEAAGLPCSAAGAWTAFKSLRGRKAVRS